MRILLICQQSPHRYPIPAYDFWAPYFRAGLAEAGHVVLEVPGADWARGLLPLSGPELASWKAEVSGRTLDAVRAGGLDLVLSYLFPRQVDPAAVRAVRALGVPWVNFYCDHLREHRSAPAEFSEFDLNWVPEKAAVAWYRGRGWPVLHAPMPCWVSPELRTPPRTERPAVSFVGSRDLLRDALLAEAARAGLPLEIRGAGWSGQAGPAPAAGSSPSWGARLQDWGGLLRRQGPAAAIRRLAASRRPPSTHDLSRWVRPAPSGAEYAGFLRDAAVALGINRFPSFRFPANRPPAYSRLRDIEAPMLGACYLTEWAEGIEELYEPDREIALYREPAELAAQARALLSDAGRRRRLREAGQRRALADHSVPRTLRRIGEALGLRP